MGLLGSPATAHARTCEVVLWLDDPATLGALQIDLDYSAAAGSFVAGPGGLECSGDVPNALAIFGHDADSDVVIASFLSLVGFSGPLRLAHCTYVDPGNSATRSDFEAIVRDASTPKGYALAAPAVSVLLPDCGDTTTTTSTTSTSTTTSTTSTTSTTATSTTTSTTMDPCGNGLVDGNEDCDDGNTDDGDGCEGDCSADVICGDANGNDAVQTGDALLVLRSAIGQPVSCPLALCDTDGDARLRTADALRVLKRAVGQSVVMSCPQDL